PGKRIVQLPAPRPARLATRGVGALLPAVIPVHVLRQRLKLVVVSRVILQAPAARHVQVDSQADAEDDDEGHGAVDPDLRLGRDAEGGEPRDPVGGSVAGVLGGIGGRRVVRGAARGTRRARWLSVTGAGARRSGGGGGDGRDGAGR